MTDFSFSPLSSDYERGKAYWQQMQTLALDPSLVALRLPSAWEEQICCAIAQRIATINQELEAHLSRCQQCFYPEQRLNIQIFATPFARHLNIDGLCNVKRQPITILIDVGRIVYADWLCAVVHEYAHAQVGVAGHHDTFLETLTHLCLGLGLTPPPSKTLSEAWPPCRPTADPLAFWLYSF